jgi:alkyl hydroperoxide reductase subunit AhpF
MMHVNDGQRRGRQVDVQITLVHAPACHFCDDAQAVLDTLSGSYPLHVERVEVTSPRGQQLAGTHRAGMMPLVLVNGRYFSSGRLPRGKLVALLDELASGQERGHG